MAGNRVSVGTEGMARASALFEAASSQSTSQLRTINSEMAALQATWTGESSMKFSQAMNDWENDFMIIIQKLNHMIEVMGGNANAYVQGADEASAVAGNWSLGLDGM